MVTGDFLTAYGVASLFHAFIIYSIVSRAKVMKINAILDLKMTASDSGTTTTGPGPVVVGRGDVEGTSR
jgi:hypothetical protein